VVNSAQKKFYAHTDFRKLEEALFLWVHIDQLLTWKTHISSVSSKVAKNIVILSRLSYLLPVQIRTSLYYTQGYRDPF